MITRKIHYYFSSTYTCFDLGFINFCNVMLVLCVYFRYLLIKGPCASKWWKIGEKRKKAHSHQKVNILDEKVNAGHDGRHDPWPADCHPMWRPSWCWVEKVSPRSVAVFPFSCICSTTRDTTRGTSVGVFGL